MVGVPPLGGKDRLKPGLQRGPNVAPRGASCHVADGWSAAFRRKRPAKAGTPTRALAVTEHSGFDAQCHGGRRMRLLTLAFACWIAAAAAAFGQARPSDFAVDTTTLLPTAQPVAQENSPTPMPPATGETVP